MDFVELVQSVLYQQGVESDKKLALAEKVSKLSYPERQQLLSDAILIITLLDSEVDASQELLSLYKTKFQLKERRLTISESSLEDLLAYIDTLYSNRIPDLRDRILAVGHAMNNLCLKGLGRPMTDEWRDLED